jgi:hypothetical protein
MFVAWRDFLSRRVTDEAVREYEEQPGESGPPPVETDDGEPPF